MFKDKELQEIWNAKKSGDDDKALMLWTHYKRQLSREKSLLNAKAGLAKARMYKIVCSLLSE